MEHHAYHHPPGTIEQADMPDEFREILIHQMLANGEGELSAGDTYVDSFYPLAPNADERYICVKFAAEEVDHFRRFARLLAEMGIDTSHMLRQDKKERRFFAAESMTTDFNTWEERAAFSFLCELEGHYQIKEMVDSPYRPLAIEAREILKEEAMHFAHGALLMRRAREQADSRHRAQQALDKMYPMALDMFGKSDSRRSRLAVKWGLRTCTNNELREVYQRDIDQHIVRLGYRVPDASAGRKYF
ncbi:phenylacetate-CoA oxygenase subunit PaaI [Chromobacterium subtsugae]|uniref:Phenylacetate-CoA oxygenase subunit PaaI n=1 Tax=Chromobacterium subtsugae TaxID=251747 RepID=A0ABS7FHB4_9NEIS|nr:MULTISPECIES: Phenylacetic acid catabolic protein [Chromobacterium]KUM03685.1 AAA family ATPase [Chromobacterium subtsugae]KZE88331.1 AAA family ATPase [Chromobacterium sp. F49]MBW7568715.1 phenylacetate-CoA oxygenase subunit PaaI [Chromobacterium subtsugae]MBW8289455.1 phenylacetate-CoA oxygenase subunit PaaI [Chromobacterium subtsugae]WSE90003.1 Phenylacetic acid catabolic protein [Chromobacterium subtsugae]